MEQIRTVADAGADLVRVAVPREKDADALRTIVKDSPIPVIADIHFNHTLALKAIDAGAHCIRLNPGNIGGRDKVAEVAARQPSANVPMRIGVNSGSLPKHLHALEREAPVEALVAAAVEFVELMECLDFDDFKVSIKSTNVPNTIAANRLLAEKIPYPIHLGITEAGTKWSGSLKSSVGLGHPARRRGRRHDPDLPLHLPRRGGGQGRLGDPQGAAAARARPGADRLPDLRPPPVRHGHRRRRDRAAARGLRGADRGRRARLRRQRHRRGLPRRLRHHRRQGRGPDLRPRQAAAEDPPGAARRRPVRGDRQVARPRRRSRSTRRRPPRAPMAAPDRGGERRRPDAREDRRDGEGRRRAAARTSPPRAAGTASLPEAGQGQAGELGEEASPTAGRRFTRA